MSWCLLAERRREAALLVLKFVVVILTQQRSWGKKLTFENHEVGKGASRPATGELASGEACRKGAAQRRAR